MMVKLRAMATGKTRLNDAAVRDVSQTAFVSVHSIGAVAFHF